MLVRGLHMPVRFSQKLAVLAALSAIVLILLKNLFVKTSSINSANTVFLMLKAAGMNDTLAAFATAQSAHETAGFTSRVLNDYNNLFGMKTADLSDYQHYNGWQDSCNAFVKWYTSHRNKIFSLPLVINDLKGYVHFLKNQNYFEADETEYLNGCTYFFNQIFPNEQ